MLHDVSLVVSYLVHRRGGLGYSVSMVLLQYSSSSPCPSCQSLPGSCCWRGETTRAVRKVWGRFGFLRILFTSRPFLKLVFLWCWHYLNLLIYNTPVALRRLWGNKDHSKEVEEMLEEKAALQGVRNRSVMELIRTTSIRWQVLTIFITYTSMQLCGINSVSDMIYSTLNTLLYVSGKMLPVVHFIAKSDFSDLLKFCCAE